MSLERPVHDAVARLHRGAEALWLRAHERWPQLRIEVLPETDSTNTQLMQRARPGQHDTVVLTTAHQTAGRGRMGRRWEDRVGDTLMFSVGMALPHSQLSGLSLAVGVALAESLGEPVRLKWPNDLWVARASQWHKLGGILTEVAHEQSRAYGVVGVGINLRTTPTPSDASVPPIAWHDLGHEADSGDLFARLADSVLSAMTQFFSGGFAPWVARFDALDALRDQTLALSDGRQGQAQGVTPDGALVLDIGGQRCPIHSQEVSVRPC